MSRYSHLVIIPSFNSGPLLRETVCEAMEQGFPVWVVVDGSDDGSDRLLGAGPLGDSSLRVIRRDRNGGKGAAVLTGALEALRQGHTHAVIMDADGQHPADRIREFVEASLKSPDAMILGRPVFGPDAPPVRLQGRKLSVGLVRLEILGPGIDDPLYGFRVYPLAPLVRIMTEIRGARRYDFDPEVAVRLFWAGLPTVNLPAPCRYRSRAEGGVSHFNYLRDNLRMVWLHTKLISGLLFFRLPTVRRIRKEHSAVFRQ